MDNLKEQSDGADIVESTINVTGRERSLLNLAPYPPGVSGNPSGRPAKTRYPADWLRVMVDYSRDEVSAIREDERAPIGQRAAAEVLLQQLDSVQDRDRRAALETVADRTTGRPAQEVHVIADTPQRSAADLLMDMQRRYQLAQTDTRTLPSSDA